MTKFTVVILAAAALSGCALKPVSPDKDMWMERKPPLLFWFFGGETYYCRANPDGEKWAEPKCFLPKYYDETYQQVSGKDRKVGPSN
jgi:hypothetical protein